MREKTLRRRQGITQEELAALGSAAFELDGLFTKPAYRNMQEVIDEQKRK